MKFPSFNSAAFLRAAKEAPGIAFVAVIGGFLCFALMIVAWQRPEMAVWFISLLLLLVLGLIWLMCRQEKTAGMSSAASHRANGSRKTPPRKRLEK